MYEQRTPNTRGYPALLSLVWVGWSMRIAGPDCRGSWSGVAFAAELLLVVAWFCGCGGVRKNG